MKSAARRRSLFWTNFSAQSLGIYSKMERATRGAWAWTLSWAGLPRSCRFEWATTPTPSMTFSRIDWGSGTCAIGSSHLTKRCVGRYQRCCALQWTSLMIRLTKDAVSTGVWRGVTSWFATMRPLWVNSIFFWISCSFHPCAHTILGNPIWKLCRLMAVTRFRIVLANPAYILWEPGWRCNKSICWSPRISWRRSCRKMIRLCGGLLQMYTLIYQAGVEPI